MFDNIGFKIKRLAKFYCFVGMIISAIVGIVFMVIVEEIVISLLIIIAGSFGSWLICFFFYGFGQLIENSDYIMKNSYYIMKNSDYIEQIKKNTDIIINKIEQNNENKE